MMLSQKQVKKKKKKTKKYHLSCRSSFCDFLVCHATKYKVEMMLSQKQVTRRKRESTILIMEVDFVMYVYVMQNKNIKLKWCVSRNKVREENEKAREGTDKLGVGSRRSSMRRASTNLEKDKIKDRPKSMVTYEKGPPRDLGHNQKIDNREIGLSHES